MRISRIKTQAGGRLLLENGDEVVRPIIDTLFKKCPRQNLFPRSSFAYFFLRGTDSEEKYTFFYAALTRKRSIYNIFRNIIT